VWIGRLEPFFVFCGAILLTAWFLNLLANPAYYGFLGEGAARWPTVSHVVLGIGNILFGLILGYLFGVKGVVVGFALALILASMTVSHAYRRQHQVRFAALVQRGSLSFLTATTVAAAIVWVILRVPPLAQRDGIALIVGPLVYVALVAVPVWRNPTLRETFEWLRSSRGNDD
jgi:O-antigen/teichoic acid export membrane protein